MTPQEKPDICVWKALLLEDWEQMILFELSHVWKDLIVGLGEHIWQKCHSLGSAILLAFFHESQRRMVLHVVINWENCYFCVTGKHNGISAEASSGSRAHTVAGTAPQ